MYSSISSAVQSVNHVLSLGGQTLSSPALLSTTANHESIFSVQLISKLISSIPNIVGGSISGVIATKQVPESSTSQGTISIVLLSSPRFIPIRLPNNNIKHIVPVITGSIERILTII